MTGIALRTFLRFLVVLGSAVPVLVAPAALVGCGDDTAADDDDDDMVAGDDDDDDDDVTPPDYCDEEGLTRRPFSRSPGGNGYAELAGDFTVDTLDGPWTLSEHWTGCESYVFINYVPFGEPGGLGDQVWGSNPAAMFSRTAPNVHYVITSYETDAAAARARVEEMRTRIEVILEVDVGTAEFEYWKDRFIYVTTPLGATSGALGAFIGARGEQLVSFGIDRLQRWDWGGLLNPFVGAPQTIEMAGWPSRYYNYHSDLADRLAEEEADTTVVEIVNEDAWTERVFTRAAMLPDASEMEQFDQLVVDVKLTCREEWRDCSEWDRNAYLRLCVDGECGEGEQRIELVRWITPYWRPGERRWLMDATPQLGWLAEGGERTFEVVLGPPWERATPRDVEISLRLRDTGAPDRAFATELAFRGGPFNAEYNESRPPITFTPPEGTTRVEVVAIVSGHGDASGTRCAEWCAHNHSFRVNEGTEHRIDWAQSDIFSPVACAERSDDGVPPGQGGNWAMSRAYWCPGLPVELTRFDVTEDVDLGGENSLAYQGEFARGLPAGGNIDLSVFVSYFR